MQTHAELNRPVDAIGSISRSRLQLVTGRALTGFVALFLLMDGVAKLIQPQPVVEVSAQLGYSGMTIFGIGVTLLACVALYLVPRTSALGALLLTAYLGGAVATHVRVGSPLFTHVLFPAYLATLIWGGLLLRNPALRVILPEWRKP